jgi:hypothetical protein
MSNGAGQDTIVGGRSDICSALLMDGGSDAVRAVRAVRAVQLNSQRGRVYVTADNDSSPT